MDISEYQTYWRTPSIGKGNDGRMHAISKIYAVKVLHKLDDVADLERVLEMQSDLNGNGINVPKPIGILPVRIAFWGNAFGLYNKERKGLVMQRLRGIDTDKIGDDSVFDRVWHQYKGQVEKAEALGYELVDHDWDSDGMQNGVYVPLEDKVYLVDLFKFRKR